MDKKACHLLPLHDNHNRCLHYGTTFMSSLSSLHYVIQLTLHLISFTHLLHFHFPFHFPGHLPRSRLSSQHLHYCMWVWHIFGSGLELAWGLVLVIIDHERSWCPKHEVFSLVYELIQNVNNSLQACSAEMFLRYYWSWNLYPSTSRFLVLVNTWSWSRWF